MNNQKFLLWKLAINVIHVDGRVAPEEKEWFHQKIKHLANNKILNFSEDQMNQLEGILEVPSSNILNDFHNLTSPADAAQLLHFIRLIGHVDGHYAVTEKDIFKTVEAEILKNIDLKAVTEKVNLMEKESYHEKEVYKLDNPGSFFEHAFKTLLKLINPGDYRDP
jgi:hypothetical protein